MYKLAISYVSNTEVIPTFSQPREKIKHEFPSLSSLTNNHCPATLRLWSALSSTANELITRERRRHHHRHDHKKSIPFTYSSCFSFSHTSSSSSSFFSFSFSNWNPSSSCLAEPVYENSRSSSVAQGLVIFPSGCPPLRQLPGRSTQGNATGHSPTSRLHMLFTHTPCPHTLAHTQLLSPYTPYPDVLPTNALPITPRQQTAPPFTPFPTRVSPTCLTHKTSSKRVLSSLAARHFLLNTLITSDVSFLSFITLRLPCHDFPSSSVSLPFSSFSSS